MTVVYILLGLFNLILLIKIWGMTNAVKRIETSMNDLQFNWRWELGEMIFYCDQMIEKCKRMIAVEDSEAKKTIKGLLYDMDIYFSKHKTYEKFFENQKKQIQELLESIK